MPAAKSAKSAKDIMAKAMTTTPKNGKRSILSAPDAPVRKRRADPYPVRMEIEKGSPTGRPAEDRIHVPVQKRLVFDEISSDEDDVFLVEMSEKLESTVSPRPWTIEQVPRSSGNPRFPRLGRR